MVTVPTPTVTTRHQRLRDGLDRLKARTADRQLIHDSDRSNPELKAVMDRFWTPRPFVRVIEMAPRSRDGFTTTPVTKAMQQVRAERRDRKAAS